jgi:hypothetical protein
MLTKFWSENLKESDSSADLDVDGSIILKWILWENGAKVGSRFIRIRIGTSGGLL